MQTGVGEGFCCPDTAAVLRKDLTGALRRNAPDPVSGVLLAQLAVELAWQGNGLGTKLVLAAMEKAVLVADLAGTRLLLVHPATGELQRFYGEFGFTGVPATPVGIMAMSMPLVRKTLRDCR